MAGVILHTILKNRSEFTYRTFNTPRLVLRKRADSHTFPLGYLTTLKTVKRIALFQRSELKSTVFQKVLFYALNRKRKGIYRL